MLKAFEKLAGRSARRFAGIEKALQKNCRREARRFRKDDSVAAGGTDFAEDGPARGRFENQGGGLGGD